MECFIEYSGLEERLALGRWRVQQKPRWEVGFVMVRRTFALHNLSN